MDPINPATNTPHQIPQVQIGVGTPPNVVQASTVPVVVAPNPATNTSLPTAVPPASPPPIHSEPHTHTHWKLIAFIFMAAFLGLAAFTVYLWNQTTAMNQEEQISILPSPTPAEANLDITKPSWTTYTNTAYKYSIQFPEDWVAKHIAAGSGDVPANSESSSIQIEEANYPKDYKFSGIAIGLIQAPILTNTTKQIINGYEMQVQETQEGEVYYIQIPNSTEYLEILGAGGYTNSEEKNILLRQIFGTFRLNSI